MKRIFPLLFGLVLVVTLTLALLPFLVSAAGETTLSSIVFTVNRDIDAGLSGDVCFKVSGSAGTIYLPGAAETDKLTLSWTPTENVTVSIGGVPYDSGTAPIPAAGETVSYSVKVGTSTTSVSVKTVQGSQEVAPLFFEIDETYGSISAMNDDTNHETPCYGYAEFEGDTYNISIKGRGNSTWTYAEKKPYNFSVYKTDDFANPDSLKKKKVNFIEGVETKSWSLLANYGDGTLLRNKVGYDLAVSLNIGIPSRFVDVWVNGEYYGNYLMTPKSDYQAPDGGYMLELDNKVENSDPQFALDGLVSAGNEFQNKITVKEIGDDAVAAGVDATAIQTYMQKVLNAIMDTSSSEYLDYIDLDSFAKFYILYDFYKSYDILSGSFMMHRDGLADSDKLYAGPIWDLDNALGRTQTSNDSGVDKVIQVSGDGWYTDSVTGEKTSLLKYLGKHADFMNRVYEIYNEFKDEFDYVTENLAAQKVLLADSAAMNFTRWSINQSKYNPTKRDSAYTAGSGAYAVNYIKTTTWDDYVTNLNSYLTARVAFFADNLTVARINGAIYTDTVYSVGDKVSLSAVIDNDNNCYYQWQISYDGDSWTDIPGATETVYECCATLDLDGVRFRCCIIRKMGVVETKRVAQVDPKSNATLQEIVLTVKNEGHTHSFEEVDVAATCHERGYSGHVCDCSEHTDIVYYDKLTHSFSGGFCTLCGDPDPNYQIRCKGEVSTTLVAGDLFLSYNGTDVGKFTFASYNNGWSIRNGSGKYLALSGSSLTYADTEFSWSYNGSAFTAKSGTSYYSSTYYLVLSNGSLNVSTRSSNSTASFSMEVANEYHTFGDWEQVASECHELTCTICGEVEHEECSFDGNVCTECGGYTLEAATVNITVTATKKYSTTYNVTITATPVGTKITKYEYSTDNSTWKTFTSGSTFTVKNPSMIYVRVTATNGKTYTYTYTK